jgi:hypothetical protein
MDIDSEYHRRKEGPENDDIGQRLDTGEIEDNPIRRSSRKVKQPTRFANKVMVGLQCGRMIHTDPIWDALLPLNPLPRYQGVTLEQDMTPSSFPFQPTINKLRELHYLDSFHDEGDPETHIEVVIPHRLTKYARRIPGKNTYYANVAPIITPGIRLCVKFFSGKRQWVPLEAARSDNPLPIIDYALK